VRREVRGDTLSPEELEVAREATDRKDAAAIARKEATALGDAYHTGYEAAKQGESREANPYPQDTWTATNWDEGWCFYKFDE
jgi:ribosome modulation factor